MTNPKGYGLPPGKAPNGNNFGITPGRKKRSWLAVLIVIIMIIVAIASVYARFLTLQ
jgi:hypothetical protein